MTTDALPTHADAASRGEAPVRMVPAVERAVRLLDTISRSRKPQSLAELAKALDIPKSSAHGLLATLSAFDLVTRNADGDFALGPRPLLWAGAYTLQSKAVEAFDALVDDQPALASETVMLAVLDGADVMYLGCRQGRRPLAVNFRVGERFPASCTSSGKAMLATMPEPRVRELMAGDGLRRLTRHSVGSVGALLRQLRTAAADGYAIDDEETAAGMHCFGAPVFAAGRSEAIAAVAVSLIKAAATPRRVAEIVEAIRALAAALSERLGAQHQVSVTDHPEGTRARAETSRAGTRRASS